MPGCHQHQCHLALPPLPPLPLLPQQQQQHHHSQHQPQSPQTEQVVARQATVDDVEAVTDILVAAMPQDPQWEYRFPHRRRLPKEHRRHTRAMVRSFINHPERGWIVMLVEMADLSCASLDGSGPGVYRKPVAAAVWNMTPYDQAVKSRATECTIPNREDADRGHMELFKKITRRTQQKYFDEHWGSEYIFLQILATHPDYQRRGAGACLVRWGIEFAHSIGCQLGVLASPLGMRLYSKLGFDSLGVAVVSQPDAVALHVMVYRLEQLYTALL